MVGITILPQDKLDIIKGAPKHMALAHLLGKPGYEKYTEFYLNESHNGSYVIMDNGVIEGAQQPLELLCEKALKYNISEMILPDVFMNAEATVESTVNAYNTILNNPAYSKIAEGVNFMIVPQGKDIDEYLWCLETLIAKLPTRPTCIGIPKVLTKLCGRDARFEVIQRLPEVLPVDYKPQIHLLGCHLTVLEAKRMCQLAKEVTHCYIRSIDSALPLVYARHFLPMNACDRPDFDPIDFSQSTTVDHYFLETQVNFWRMECSGAYLEPIDKVIKVTF